MSEDRNPFLKSQEELEFDFKNNSTNYRIEEDEFTEAMREFDNLRIFREREIPAKEINHNQIIENFH